MKSRVQSISFPCPFCSGACSAARDLAMVLHSNPSCEAFCGAAGALEFLVMAREAIRERRKTRQISRG